MFWIGFAVGAFVTAFAIFAHAVWMTKDLGLEHDDWEDKK